MLSHEHTASKGKQTSARRMTKPRFNPDKVRKTVRNVPRRRESAVVADKESRTYSVAVKKRLRFAGVPHKRCRSVAHIHLSTSQDDSKP